MFAEQRDQIRRHFQYDWHAVAACNPDYGRYVEGEMARLGEDHPILRTQYCLETLAGSSGFLSDAQRAQMQGDHDRVHRALPGREYVAAYIDFVHSAEGIYEAAQNPAAGHEDEPATATRPAPSWRRRWSGW